MRRLLAVLAVAILASPAGLGGSARAAPLFDGDDGATCDWFNAGARLAWRHRQGDWRDAKGVEQGPAAFATARVRATDASRAIAWNVTELARGWLSGAQPESGMLIRGLPEPNAGVAVFHSREARDPELRPRLVLTLQDGSIRRLAPIADTTLDCSTYRSIGGRETLAASVDRMVLVQFDLAALRGLPLAGASLELATTDRQYGDSMLGVYRLDPPGPAAPPAKPRPGLAAAYPRDRGIETDRDVLMATGFESVLWPKDWSYVSLGSQSERVDAGAGHGFRALDGHALQVRIPRGGHLGLDLGYRFADKQGAEPEEIYFRYYLRLGEDWNPTTDGGKLPGVSGTYGKAGWGGRKSDGTNGWSMRGGFFKQPGPGNPYRGLTPVGTYAYHSRTEDYFGDSWPWAVGALGLLEKNRWYCIEQYFRVNRLGREDGEFRAWIDGRLAFEKTGIHVRDVPTIRIEQIWMNVYYGGTTPSPSDQHLFIDNVVIARRYIGPMAE